MALTHLEENLNIIQGLADLPNSDDGLDAAELKAKFDEAVNIIKDYINKTLIPEVESDIDAASKGISSGGGIDGAQLVDGSVASSKLASNSVTSAKIGNKAVTAEKIADKTITRAQLADDVTTIQTEDFPNKSVPTRALQDNAVTAVKIADGAVGEDKLADDAVTPEKLDRPYLSIGVRTEITSNTDLDNLTNIGCYGCRNTAVTDTLLNIPEEIKTNKQLFTLDVKHAYGGTATTRPASGNYYIIQELETHVGEKYFRRGIQTSTTLNWNDWKRRLTTDDLYSRIIPVNGDHYLTKDDIGGFLRSYSIGTAMNVIITAENSTDIPNGMEIPINRYGQASAGECTLTFDGVNVCCEGWENYLASPTLRLPNSFSTVVVKKLTTNNMWYVIGNVEVVS